MAAALPRAARRIGAVLEATDFHPGRTGRDHLRMLGHAVDIPDSSADEVLRLVELGRRRPATCEGVLAGDASATWARAWAPQRHAGIELTPAEPPIDHIESPRSPPLIKGQDVVLAFRTIPFHVTSACRILYTVEEPDRYGFGYGTLPHHPERGEEAFLVERTPDSLCGIACQVPLLENRCSQQT